MLVSDGSKPNRLIIPIKEMASLFFSSPRALSSHASASHSTHSSHTAPHTPRIKFSETMMEENIENAEIIISKWDLNSSSINKVTSLFHNDREEAKEFLKSVKDLRRAMQFLVSEKPASDKLVNAQNLMEIAMKRLEKELYQILSTYREKLDPESISTQSSDASSSFDDRDEAGSEDEIKTVSESNTEGEKISMLAVSDLKSIADCMTSSGYGKECVTIYKIMRKSIVEESLYQLGIERFKSSHIHKMSWEALESIVKVWLRAVKVAVKSLFHGEKFLCEQVFAASMTMRESCFSEVIKDGAMNIFRFPEHVAKHKKSPENIFRLMELYEALSDLWQDIDLVFCYESTTDIRSQALSSLGKLANAIQSVLSDFESTIQKDSRKTPVAGGGIHPLTQSATNYITSLAAYGKTLSDVLTIYPPQRTAMLPESVFESPTSKDPSTSAASTHLAWLILVLLCKLDTKAALYKDVALSYLFLANNLHFIIEKVCTTNLQNLLGDEWVIRHVKKVRQYASKYEAVAWNKVLSSLPEKNSPILPPEAAKACFRRFNAAFEEAYRKQTAWTVPDRMLRDELKLSIDQKLVPAYRQFFDTYLLMLTEERNSEVLIRFAPDDLENYLSDLFHGTAVLGSLSSSPSLHVRGCLLR